MDFDKYLDDNFRIFRAIEPDKLFSLVQALTSVREAGGTLWVAGNGGSAAAASHFVADLVKTARSFTGKSLPTIALHECISLTTAYSNDQSFEASLGETLRDLARPGDALLILSVSGTSPNLVYAKGIADQLGLVTLSIVGEKGSALSGQSTVGICLKSGDYQIVENAHILILHWLAKNLN